MPDSTPAPRSWQLWAVAVAGIAVLTGVLILSLASARLDQPALRAFFIGWIVVPYVLSGVIAWWRRPSSRIGPLMLLLGFTMALTPLQWSSQPLLHSVGHVLDMVPAAIFLHIFLSYPSGRLTRSPERWLVASCYVITLGLQLVKIGLGSNRDSIFRVADQPELANVVEAIQLGLVALCLLLGTVALYHRRRRSSRSLRRASALVVDAFGFALVMLALLYIGAIFSWPYLEGVRLVAFAALGLAPIAFLIGLLDLQLARGNVAQLVVELRADPTIDLQAPLARALRDPTLRLSYWLPEFAVWADQTGRLTAVPAAADDRSVRILRRPRPSERESR